MEIKDLQPRQSNVDLAVEVTEKGEERTFQKFGKEGRVATATVKDNTGEVKLTLWNESIDKVNVGDKLQLKNCYVNEFQGDMQLTTGKFGSIEVIGKAEPKPAEAAQSEEEELGVEEEDISGEE